MLHIAPHPEWHALFEALGYLLGFATYKRLRQASGDALEDQQRWAVIAAATIGALVGSRALGLLEQIPPAQITLSQALLPTGGKSIVGGLIGGWISVELVKSLRGIRSRTGDLFGIPLCLGIAVGRIGCLLAGLAEDTYGTPTTLPWGVDFGDGLPRHPTQAYEICFACALALALRIRSRRPHPQGALFRIFLAAYLAWRLMIDFLKPELLWSSLSPIQWSCALGLFALLLTWHARQPKALAGPEGDYA